DLGDVLTYELVPNFKLLGPRLGKRVQQLRAAMGDVDGAAAAGALGEGQPVTVQLPDGPVELGADEVELRVKAQPGFAVSRDGAEVVALDLTVDTELWQRGLAREVVRQVQEMRKAAGLEVSDWIHLHLLGLDFLGIPLHELIGREVLARSVESTPPPPDRGAGEGTALDLEGEDGAPLAARAWVIKV
ncbi:MAG: DUF5915 domain-containing protein, partial [Acidimicrobiales bacterium]